MRSAGENKPTATKATEDQLAARRAGRAQRTRATRSSPSREDGSVLAPIDPSLGTGLIDNIICEPEDTTATERVDDLLDRYTAGADGRPIADAPATAPERSADGVIDEIQAQLERCGEWRAASVDGGRPRGSADVQPDVAQVRPPRRRVGGALHGHIRPSRAAVAAGLATLLVAAGALTLLAGRDPHGNAGHVRPPAAAAVTVTHRDPATAHQLTVAARARALRAITAEKKTASSSQALVRRTRHRAPRPTHHEARHKPAKPSASTAATTEASASAQTTDPQPIASSAKATPTSSNSTVEQAPARNAPPGPTTLGSMSGGCSPQC